MIPTLFNWNGDSLTPPAMNNLFIYELHIGTFHTTPAQPILCRRHQQAGLLEKPRHQCGRTDAHCGVRQQRHSWGYDPAQPLCGGQHPIRRAGRIQNLCPGLPSRGAWPCCSTWCITITGRRCWTCGTSMALRAPTDRRRRHLFLRRATRTSKKRPTAIRRPNFSSQQVSNFVQDNFTLWLSEYHVDGFRWDTPGLDDERRQYGYIPAAGNLISAINSMIHTNYTGKDQHRRGCV